MVYFLFRSTVVRERVDSRLALNKLPNDLIARSQKIRDQPVSQFPTRSHMNFGGLVLSGNLDQTITQLNAPHDFRPQRHEPS
jgi:hypothetical protein